MSWYEARQLERLVDEAVERFRADHPGVRPVVSVKSVDGDFEISVHPPRVEAV